MPMLEDDYISYTIFSILLMSIYWTFSIITYSIVICILSYSIKTITFFNYIHYLFYSSASPCPINSFSLSTSHTLLIIL